MRHRAAPTFFACYFCGTSVPYPIVGVVTCPSCGVEYEDDPDPVPTIASLKAMMARAILAEREACIKAAEEWEPTEDNYARDRIIEAIRARGQLTKGTQ